MEREKQSSILSVKFMLVGPCFLCLLPSCEIWFIHGKKRFYKYDNNEKKKNLRENSDLPRIMAP